MMALANDVIIGPNLDVIVSLETDTAVRHLDSQVNKYSETIEDMHEIAHRYILSLDNSSYIHKFTAKGDFDYHEIQGKFADVIQACKDYQAKLPQH